MKPDSSRLKNMAAFWLPVLFLSLSFLLPIILVICQIDFKQILSAPNERYLGNVFLFTIKQAFFSSLCSLLLAIPGAYLISRYQFPGKKLLIGILTVPFILPGILVVLGFILVFGNNGYLNRFFHTISGESALSFNILYSYKAIILAHVFYNFPVAIRLISSSWSVIPDHWEEAARTLGAGKIKTFFRIVVPQLLPSLLASFFLIFLYCFMSFIIVLVLGGGPEFSTIEVEIYRQIKSSVNYTAAAKLALGESLISFSLLTAYLIFENKAPRFSHNRLLFKTRKLGELSFKGLWILYLLVISLLIISPMLAVMIQSLTVKTSLASSTVFSLKNYLDLITPDQSRFSNGIHWTMISSSLLIAFFSLIISVGTSILISSWLFNNRKSLKGIEFLFILPMGVSSLITGLGYLLLSRYLPDFSFIRFFLIILAHALSSFPLVFRSVRNHYQSLNYSLIEAGKTLGANSKRIFLSLELPLVKTGIRTGAVFALALSLGEINATLLLSDGKIKTIPIAIYQLIGSYNFAGACVLGTILILFCISVFRFADAWRN